MRTCPSDHSLRLIADDELDPVIFEAIEDHVEQCPACRERLESLAWECPGREGSAPCPLPEAGEVPEIPGFEIDREIGRGSMGAVYLAWDQTLGRQVALKVMQALPGIDRAARKRWLREAKAFSRLRHPNVVVLHDIGEAHSWLYLVLEYIPGRTLKDRLEGPQPPREAAKFVAAIADASHHIHQAGLLHLDLKPSNILLEGEADAPLGTVTPRVSDFGLAVADGGHDVSQTSLACPRGTPCYMSPEQASPSGVQIGAASDIHALGAILYELLTGRPPFLGTSTLETLDQVRHQNPVPPRRLNRKIPRDLETIALKCLEKNPSRRYASAEALAGDLRRWLDGKPILARPVSPIEHASRWCRRRPAIAALVATLMMTLSVGFFTIVLLWRRAEAERSRAEVERSHAVSDFLTTSEVLSELFERTMLEIGPTAAYPDRFVPELQQLRNRLLAVEARHPEQLSITRQIAIVNKVLGNFLSGLGRSDEARTLFDASLHRLEMVLRQSPLDHDARAYQIDALWGLAYTAEMQSTSAEALGNYRLALDAAESLACVHSGAVAIRQLENARNLLAEFLARHGDLEQAGSSTAARAAALWNNGSGPLYPVPKLSGQDADRLLPKDWAELAANSLRSAAPTGIGPAQETEAGHRLAVLLGILAAQQRHGDQLDVARRTADRMLALGRLLVARHPKQAAAHLALSEAYRQLYKNAWQTDDRTVVERNLRLSVDVALQAQRLDTNSELARITVDQLQRRLRDLLNPK